MSKTLIFFQAAAKAFARLPLEVQEQLVRALFNYGAGRPSDVKRMLGLPGFRLRAGDYRAMFVETDNALEIRGFGHRREVYR